MKLKYITMLMASLWLTLITTAGRAQNHLDTLKYHITDFCSAECTRIYLEKLSEKDTQVLSDYQLIVDQLKTNHAKNPLSADKLDGLLDDKFKVTASRIVAPIRKIQFGDILLNNPSEIVNAITDSIKKRLSTNNAQKIDFEIIRTKLIPVVNGMFHADPTAAASPQDSVNRPSNGEGQSESTTTPPPSPSTGPSIWDIMAYVLACGAIVFALIKSRAQTTRLNRHSDRLKTLFDETEKLGRLNLQSPSKEITKSSIAQMIDNAPAVERLASDLHGIANRLSRLESGDTPKQPQRLPQPEEPRAKAADEVFYMPYPTDNSFLQQARTDSKTNTMYVFRVRRGGTEAEFELHTTGGVPISSIISGIERYIRPACIEQNLPRLNTQNIVNRVPGLATLQSDRWAITRKAEISYE